MPSNDFNQITSLVKHDNIPYYYYYYFNFSEEARWKLRHKFLYHDTIRHLFALLANVPNASIINNKLEFYHFCIKHDIPTAKVFGYTSEKKIIMLNDNLFRDYPNFIIKPIKGSKGQGFNHFIFHQDKMSYYDFNQKKFIPSLEIKIWIANNYQDDYLLQELLINHSSIAAIGNEHLAIIRILSIKDTNNIIHSFRPIIKIPQGNTILSYMHEGAQTIAINMATGRLEETLKRGSKAPRFPEIENEIFQKITIPFWDELKKLTLKSHSLLDELVLIGWDIAITPNGLVFLEGNLEPYLDIHQKMPFEPFIDTPFYEILIKCFD